MTAVEQTAYSLGLPDVSRETVEALQVYVSEIARWTQAINLVGKATVSDIWQRHVVDCAQLWPHVEDDRGRIWLDMGSGAGLPGLVLAILSMDSGRRTQITLMESDQRKAAFLNAIKAKLDLSVDIQSVRVEEAPPMAADVITGRAFAPLVKLLGYAARHKHLTTKLVLLKGENYRAEIDQACTAWRFDTTVAASETNPKSAILTITNLQPR